MMLPTLILRTRQNGFTLLEALVTVVILSIGLLGLLGLQTVSLINTQVSAARSQASIAADNMANRIRANPVGASNGDYLAVSHPAADDTAKPSKGCTGANSCTPQEIAKYTAEVDAWQWDRSLSDHELGTSKKPVPGLLPNGRGYISCAAPKNATSNCISYNITVGWNERDPAGKRAGNKTDHCPEHTDVTRCFTTMMRP